MRVLQPFHNRNLIGNNTIVYFKQRYPSFISSSVISPSFLWLTHIFPYLSNRIPLTPGKSFANMEMEKPSLKVNGMPVVLIISEISCGGGLIAGLTPRKLFQ